MHVQNQREKKFGEAIIKGKIFPLVCVSMHTPDHCISHLLPTHTLLCRRSIQFTQCGFHCVAHQPYQDVGQVILDDRRLLLEGLGHASKDEQV